MMWINCFELVLKILVNSVEGRFNFRLMIIFNFCWRISVIFDIGLIKESEYSDENLYYFKKNSGIYLRRMSVFELFLI